MSQNDNPKEQSKSLAIQRIENLKVALNEDYIQSQLRNALAENSSSFAGSLIDLYTSEKTLQECDPKLVVMQAMKAAVLKLPVVKNLGYAWIVAYKGVPQFQIGYKGLIQLAIRTAQYRTLNADVVYEGEYRNANKLTGEFDLNGLASSDKVIGFFAHFELKNGFSKTFYMTKDKVDAHARKYSKSYNSNNSPWKSEFDAMAIKTVLSILLRKWGYLSIEMIDAMNDDEANDATTRVQNEINRNANTENIGFDEAEVVGSTVNHSSFNQPTTAPF